MGDLNLIPLFPEIFLSITAMGLLIVGVNQGNKSTSILIYSAVLALVVTAIFVIGQYWEEIHVLNRMFVFDGFAGFIKVLIILGLVLSLVLSEHFLEQDYIKRFEFPILVLLAGVGMMVMVSASNMLTLYMGLELQSLSLYVLAAFRRGNLRSSEAGIKYFILGALSSGMLLFGMSLIYGYSGSLDYESIREALTNIAPHHIGPIIGMVFVLAGIGFKISVFPFHMWTPDVYQGAATNVTALFAIVPKIAAIAVLIRLLFEPFAGLSEQWLQVIYALSVGSMVVGAFAALVQENIKRLMAYSSIGNMGYILIGLVAGGTEGISAVIFYLTVYMVMTAGVFSVLLSMRRNGMNLSRIEDLSGLSQTHPKLAYALMIFMFSMSGIPPAAGFISKLVIFNAAVANGFFILAVIGIVASVVAAYYYLRVIKVMFFDEPLEPLDHDIPLNRKIVMFATLIFTLLFIFVPNTLLETTNSIAISLLLE